MAGQNYDFIPVETVAEIFVVPLARSDLLAVEPKNENVGTDQLQPMLAFTEFWWQQWARKGNW